MADSIAAVPGRFSVVVVDPASGRLAAATSPSGGDPLYVGGIDDRVVVSSWAVPVARLLGAAESPLDPVAVCSMVNNGFMATRRTPFPGVVSLAPATTLIVDDGRVEVHDRLAGMIAGQRPATKQSIDRLHDAFVASFAPLRTSDAPVRLALSGGKDSRLVLAGLVASGVDVQTSTISMGSANEADVSITRRVAELAGVPHSVRSALVGGGLPPDRVVDVYAATCRTLHLTDGMLHGFTTFAPATPFRPDGAGLGGGGGEILRGGYGHGFLSPKLQPPAQVASLELIKRFTRFGSMLRSDVLDEYRTQLRGELAESADGLSGAQLLDRSYLNYRSSGWLAMTLRVSSLNGLSVHPACDNAVVAAAVAIDAAERSTERITYELMKRLSPKLAALPFANDEWAFGRSVRQRAQRLWAKRLNKHQGTAAVVGPTNADWRSRFHQPPLDAEFASIILGDESGSPLSAIVDRPALQKLLSSDAWGPPRYTQLAFNLYTAAVLESHDWMTSPPATSRPIRIPEYQ